VPRARNHEKIQAFISKQVPIETLLGRLILRRRGDRAIWRGGAAP
jgi:hypothetical protein